MTEPGPDAGAVGADESFDKVLAETQEKMARLSELQAKSQQISVSATSPDGSVTATVNASGVLTSLRITDRLSGQPGARIADQVMATTRQAQARIAGAMSEVMRDVVGDDPEIADRVLTMYHSRFPQPPQSARPDAVDEMRFDQQPGSPPPAPTPPAPMVVPRRARRSPLPEEGGWEDPDTPIMEEI